MNWQSLFFYEAKEGAYNADAFVDFLRQFIGFLRRESYKKAYIVIANVRFHHDDAVRGFVDGTRYEVVYFPAYSPFLNPIENLFIQLKHYMKKFRPKTADEVFQALSLASQFQLRQIAKIVTSI